MRAVEEKFLVFSGMRNEGPFIVEWVAWYKMLGFEILIATNDCTDHSPDLLNRLQDHGVLTHTPHIPRPDEPPKLSAYRAGQNHPVSADADWVLVCDVDEFLVLHLPETPTIQDFIGDGDRDFLGMAFNWRCFGTGGWRRYNDGLVHQQFRRVGLPKQPCNEVIKSMFRKPMEFKKWGDHTPYHFTGGALGHGPNIWVDSNGQEITKFRDPDNHPVRRVENTGITHATAQMNHYILRSTESYHLKLGRPSASAHKDRYTDAFYKRHNKNNEKDVTALAHKDRFTPIYDQLMALPDIYRLHHLCCAEYVKSLCDYQDLPYRDDLRWRHHMEQAEHGRPG